MFRRLLPLLAAAAVLAASSKDDDGGGITEPPPPPTEIEQLYDVICLRGTVAVGRSVDGTLNGSDCDSADFIEDDEGYFEAWRVRVSSRTLVTFDAQSGFDNVLTIFSVRDTVGEPEIELVTWNDDRPSGGTNAFTSAELRPGLDYIVIVGGYDNVDHVSYRLNVRAVN
jgi:hypothetical protein